jgi:hypothetical protein
MANKGNKVNYNAMAKEDLVKGIVQEKQRYYKMQFNHAVSPLGQSYRTESNKKKYS